MKVLHLVSSSTLTGPADPALGIARAQRALGVETWLACDRQRTGNLLEKAAQAGVPVIDGPTLCTKAGLFTAVKDRRWLSANGPQFDVVHAHSSHDHALAATAGLSARLFRSIHHPRSARRRGLQGYAYRRTRGLFIVASAYRDLLLDSYPELEADRVWVVPGAIDPERFCPTPDGPAVRQSLGIPADAFVIGMVARFQAGRRQTQLIEAFARAQRQTQKPMRLALIGKGETKEEIETAVAEAGIASSTHFYGFRDDDLPAVYASCDVTVLLKEGNDAGCRAVLESMACGVPVIGARFPAIEEALSGTENLGWLVRRDEIEPLTLALLDAANRAPEALRAMGERARQRALARHTDRARAQAVLRGYEVPPQ